MLFANTAHGHFNDIFNAASQTLVLLLQSQTTHTICKIYYTNYIRRTINLCDQFVSAYNFISVRHVNMKRQILYKFATVQRRVQTKIGPAGTEKLQISTELQIILAKKRITPGITQ